MICQPVLGSIAVVKDVTDNLLCRPVRPYCLDLMARSLKAWGRRLSSEVNTRRERLPRRPKLFIDAAIINDWAPRPDLELRITMVLLLRIFCSYPVTLEVVVILAKNS